MYWFIGSMLGLAVVAFVVASRSTPKGFSNYDSNNPESEKVKVQSPPPVAKYETRTPSQVTKPRATQYRPAQVVTNPAPATSSSYRDSEPVRANYDTEDDGATDLLAAVVAAELVTELVTANSYEPSTTTFDSGSQTYDDTPKSYDYSSSPSSSYDSSSSSSSYDSGSPSSSYDSGSSSSSYDY